MGQQFQLSPSNELLQFASQAQVDDFYTKLNNTGSIGDANLTPCCPRYRCIVGPQPAVGSTTAATDTTASASPYIYNCSIRSEYGLCGIFANGAGVGGFRSMVVASSRCQPAERTPAGAFTGTNWVSVTNFTVQDADPDNIRMSRIVEASIRAINRAIIQEVSVFAIGQGVTTGLSPAVFNHPLNSNFGGCAAPSEGYNADAPQDSGYASTSVCR